MQLVVKPLRPVGFLPGKRAWPFFLMVGLLLALAAPAQAQVQVAPLVFNNQTNRALEIESESYDGVIGVGTVPLRLIWKVNPGAQFLVDQKQNKIYARKFMYRVKTPGKMTRWTSFFTGPDKNGNFVATFTQDHLRIHLGQTVVAQRPPLIPLPQAGPTQEQQANAVAKTLVAAGAHALAQKVAEKTLNDPNSSVGQRFLAIAAIKLALETRNAAVRSALSDLFPRLTPPQAADVQRLISDTLDRRLNFNEGQQAAKQRLVNSLRSTNPDLAGAAVIADYIYAIYLVARRR